MKQSAEKNEVIEQLQREIRSLQGFKRAPGSLYVRTGLPALDMAFPERTFPVGAVHEFISPASEEAAATNGFIAGILTQLMAKQGACLWVSARRTLFPPALKVFGIAPDRIIFVDLTRPKDVLWAIEEGLKCTALAAVVGELSELSFTESRRLQLAVEESRVTGFIHRCQPRSENTVACITRWKIEPLLSVAEDNMPGVGLPRWHVQLLKVRNGQPGSWQVEWSGSGFRPVMRAAVIVLPEVLVRKTG